MNFPPPPPSSGESGACVAGRVSLSWLSEEAPMMVLATNQRERTKPRASWVGVRSWRRARST